ncbi:hypothetical protein ACIBP6_05010 [Nonomuraea terrae]|uniref:hypothetical protein n=1 Tax=Nonomuraea terrae TaxID=2530383 RepID=UPI003799C39E
MWYGRAPRCPPTAGCANPPTSGPARFAIRLNDTPWDLAIGPGTLTKVLTQPGEELRGLVGPRAIVGSQDEPEVRLLTAYMDLVGERLEHLGESGVRAARNAVVELVKGALVRRVVAGGEPATQYARRTRAGRAE